MSLYNAARKLPTFLQGILQLSETTRGAAELILIDSHSPDNTQEVAARELRQIVERPDGGIGTLYVRTAVRETIQRAWNRGIAFSRGEYLAFLGADEMNRPDTFDILGGYLDRNPAVDWVQGNALVTEVDDAGTFVRDVMTYNRTFNNSVMHYLDTCYIGYVGALYRRTVHDRVGFYDDRFRAAGDTEFKNRALPAMTVRTLPELLGFFRNYPEERTTHSPTAEIEDIRAWYLYRSPPGMAYAFDRTDSADAVELFVKCLGHCKSYIPGQSTDLDLAESVAVYLTARKIREIAGHWPAKRRTAIVRKPAATPGSALGHNVYTGRRSAALPEGWAAWLRSALPPSLFPASAAELDRMLAGCEEFGRYARPGRTFLDVGGIADYALRNVLTAAVAVTGVRDHYRALDALTDARKVPGGVAALAETTKTIGAAGIAIGACEAAGVMGVRPGTFRLNNDNRWQQHQLLWPSRSQPAVATRPVISTATATEGDLAAVSTRQVSRNIRPVPITRCRPATGGARILGKLFSPKSAARRARPPVSAARLIAAADRARGARDWANAALLYQQALTVDPELTAIWVQLGHALKEQGDRAEAEAAYRRSIALNGGISDTHLQLGHVLKMQGHRSDAAKAYFTALRLDPAASDPRLELRGLGYSDDEITVAVTTGFLLSA